MNDLSDMTDNAKLFVGCALIAALCSAGVALLLELFGALTQ